MILVLFLAGACGPILPEQGSNETATSAPTFTPVPPTVTPTSTPEVVYVTDVPTPMPTPQPLPIFTPDAIQVERWQEYETALAKSILPHISPEVILCEWAILGKSNQEVYVWAVCDGGGRASAPAIIYLTEDGAIQRVKAINYDATRNSEIQRLFPLEIQEKIFSELTAILDKQLIKHLDHRQSNPEVPPLILLNVTPTS